MLEENPLFEFTHLTIFSHLTQPNPIQLNPIQPNPTQPNPTQSNPTQPNLIQRSKKIPFSNSLISQFSRAQPNPTQPNQIQSNRSNALHTLIDDLMNSWFDITAGLHRAD